MKTKTLCLTFLLMLTALCTLTPRLLANEGDWTPTTDVQWWWKYVRTVGDPHLPEVSRVDVVLTRSARTGYIAHQVTFTLVNKNAEDYKGGGSYLLEHAFCEPDPHPWIGPSTWRPNVLAKGILPAIAAGRAIQISGIAYTPEKGKYDNYVQLTVGQ